MVVIQAPAGYGKTTTAALWEAADERPFIWVQIEASDDDPVRFLRHLLAAIEEVAPVDPDLKRRIEAPGSDAKIDLLPVVQEARSVVGAHVLVLDDAHRLTDAVTTRCVDALLESATGAEQVALLTRSEPPYRLGRLRMHDAVLDLVAGDLALNEIEAMRLFDEAGLDLDGTMVLDLVARTEGWAGGLHLAALAIARRPDTHRGGFLLGPDRLVADFLVEEVLAGLSDGECSFLEESATVAEMSVELLDELLESDDARRQLDRVERSGNHFLVPLDDERHWYRYHHLFGDLLRERLRSRDPERSRVLHRRASILLEQRDDTDAAIAHAIEGGDLDRASTLIYRHAAGLALTGESATLRRWLFALGRHRVEHDALASMAMAWYGFATNDVVLFRTSAARAEQLDWVGPLPDGSPSIETVLAFLRGMTSDVAEMRDHADKARAVGPDANPCWAGATALRATAGWMSGDVDGARSMLRASLPMMAGQRSFEAFATAHLALLELDSGHRDEAIRLTRRAKRIVDDENLGRLFIVVPVFEVAALVEALEGRREESARSAAHALELLARLEGLLPRAEYLASVVLARAALANRDRDAARPLLDRAEELSAADPAAVRLAQMLATARKDYEGSDPAGRDVPRLTEAERRVLDQLATHLTLQEISDQLFISKNTTKSHLSAIYRKLGVTTRSGAVAEARRVRLLP
ncbi:MAG: hypothetical protein JWO77_3710 [Ilumatobacteraceae bacterium]|nr:hypothetical protein [Ilumatobacteraceae bacterium]